MWGEVWRSVRRGEEKCVGEVKEDVGKVRKELWGVWESVLGDVRGGVGKRFEGGVEKCVGVWGSCIEMWKVLGEVRKGVLRCGEV